MTVTLAQLLTAPTKEAIAAKIIAGLQGRGFPTTDWATGGPERTMVEAFSDALLDAAAEAIPAIASGGFLDLATDAHTGWLALHGQQVYNLTASAATSTTGYITLICAAGSGPYTIGASDLWFRSAAGNLYVNTGTGTLRAPGFSAVTQVGVGVGTVATSGSTGNDTGLSVQIKIIGAGGLGVGTFQWSNDGGTTFGTTTTIPGGGSHTDARSGITVVFAGANFDATDTYSFESYGKLRVAIKSEGTNDSTVAGRNYVDANGTITTLVTPLPGVTCTNDGSGATGIVDFSSVTQVGSGGGTVTPSRTSGGTTPPTGTLVITIASSGQIAAATFDYSFNGASVASGVAMAAGAIALGGAATGITVTFADHASLNPSFILGDTFTISVPASWVTVQSADKESDESYRKRCRGRWPNLSESPTVFGYEALVLNAREADSSFSQITRVAVATSATVVNRVNIYLAGQAGAVTAALVSAMQSYLESRVPETDDPLVASASNQAITLAGTISYRGNLTAIQQAIQANLQAYIYSDDVGMGGVSGAGVVRLAEITERVMKVDGVVDLTGLTINTVGANYTLSAGPPPAVPTLGTVTGMFTWTAV